MEGLKQLRAAKTRAKDPIHSPFPSFRSLTQAAAHGSRHPFRSQISIGSPWLSLAPFCRRAHFLDRLHKSARLTQGTLCRCLALHLPPGLTGNLIAPKHFSKKPGERWNAHVGRMAQGS